MNSPEVQTREWVGSVEAEPEHAFCECNPDLAYCGFYEEGELGDEFEELEDPCPVCWEIDLCPSCGL